MRTKFQWLINQLTLTDIVIFTVFLRSPSWLGWPLWNICVTNNHGYVPLVVNTSRSFPRSWIITGFVTRLSRRVSLVEQELLILPEHLILLPVLLYIFFWPLCCLLFFDIGSRFENYNFEIKIICPSEATCLPVDFSFR
jgi:hypothetical protein